MPNMFSLETESPSYDVADELLIIIEQDEDYQDFIHDI